MRNKIPFGKVNIVSFELVSPNIFVAVESGRGKVGRKFKGNRPSLFGGKTDKLIYRRVLGNGMTAAKNKLRTLNRNFKLVFLKVLIAFASVSFSD